MNKSVMIISILIVIFAVLAWVTLNRQTSNTLPIVNSPTGMTMQPSESPAPVDENQFVDFTSEKQINIRIKDFKYIPAKIKISAGSTVTWTNEDDMEHNAMLDHEDMGAPHDTNLGIDPNIFEGPMLAKGESYSYTFSKASSNPYHCSPHPDMKGVIEVIY